MTPFKLKIITPEKVFFDGQTESIIVKTNDGSVGILANHISYTTILPSGPLKVKKDDGTYRLAAVSSGVLRVGSNDVKIIASAIEWADEIDVDRANSSKKSAEDLINRLRQGDREYDLAEFKLKRALNRLSISDQKYPE